MSRENRRGKTLCKEKKGKLKQKKISLDLPQQEDQSSNYKEPRPTQTIDNAQSTTSTEPVDSPNVSKDALEAYQRWRNENFAEASVEKCPKVQVQKLLHLVHRLKTEVESPPNAIEQCINHQHSEFEAFWDSPSHIMGELRQGIYDRKWSEVVELLIILLNYDKKHLSLVRNICRAMVRVYPPATDMQDQFKILLKEEPDK